MRVPDIFGTHATQFANEIAMIKSALPETLTEAAKDRIALRWGVCAFDAKVTAETLPGYIKYIGEREAAESDLAPDWRHVPTPLEALRYRAAEYEKIHGTQMPAENRIAAIRELNAMTPDELLAVMPQGGAGPQPAEAAAAAKKEQPTVKMRDLSDTDLRQIMSERLGVPAHSIMPSKFREWKAALLKQDGGPMNPNDKAALARAEQAKAGGRPLTAEERITAYRITQAEAVKTKAGSR